MPIEPAKINLPTKDIDLDLLVFIERYATNFLRWDLLTYFGQHPDNKRTAQDIATYIGRSCQVIRPEIGELTVLGVLDQLSDHSQPLYQLTTNPSLRSQVLKFAQKLPITPARHR
jgi:hypothetical protein